MHADDPRQLALRTASLATLLGNFYEDGGVAERSEATQEILRRFEPLLRKYFRRIGERPDTYRDFVQDVVLRLLLALPKLRNPDAFAGLMRRIVVGAAADAVRKRTRESARADVELLEQQSHEQQIRELAAVFDCGFSTALVVRASQEELPPRERQVIDLLIVQGLELSEAAQRLGMSHATIRMIKSRAVKRLRRILAEKIKAEA